MLEWILIQSHKRPTSRPDLLVKLEGLGERMDFCELYTLLVMPFMIHFKEVGAFSLVFSSLFSFLSKMVVKLH